MNTIGNPSLDSPDPEVDQLNLLSRERLLAETEHMRIEVINRSYEAVILFARKDQVTYRKLSEPEYVEDQELFYFVEPDFLAAPIRDSYLSTWSIGLAADTELGQTGNEKICIYMPIPEEVHDLLYECDIDTIPKPDRIFIEYIDERGGLNRYELTEKNLFRYITEGDTGGEQVHEADNIDWLLDSLSRRVDSRLPVIAQLQEALINMKVVPRPSKKTDATTSQ